MRRVNLFDRQFGQGAGVGVTLVELFFCTLRAFSLLCSAFSGLAKSVYGLW